MKYNKELRNKLIYLFFGFYIILLASAILCEYTHSGKTEDLVLSIIYGVCGIGINILAVINTAEPKG